GALAIVQVSGGGGTVTMHSVTSNGTQSYTSVSSDHTQLGTLSLNSTYDSGGADILLYEGAFAGNPRSGRPNEGTERNDEKQVPDSSLIFKGDKAGDGLNFITRGGAFVMGQNQKITVIGGNLNINTLKDPAGNARRGAGGDVYIGDLSASGDISI